MSKFPPFEELSPEERREVGNMFADLARAVQFRDDPLRQRYYGGDGQKSIDLDISRLEASLYAFYSERVVPEDKGGNVRSPRSERRENIGHLRETLKDYAFAMLAEADAARRERMRREISSGKNIADMTGIRQASVGTILDLKGKNGDCDSIAQLYFNICRDAEFFRMFVDYERVNGPSINMSADELYARLVRHCVRLKS